MGNTTMKTVYLYSDGACHGNPGPGAFGTILVYNGHERELSEFTQNTTNNRMEILGVIRGLQALKVPCHVIVTTDSRYVVDAFNKGWINGWLAKGLAKRPNGDLWIELVNLCSVHAVEFNWVRGHVGHEYNERCDKIATKTINMNT